MDWLSNIRPFGIYFLLAYLIGSVPYGYLFGKLKGINIQQHGSGNIGATNVGRVMGKRWGIMTFVLDFLKAPLTGLVYYFSVKAETLLISVLIVVGAVIGHNYPLWLKFKGGKGIATSAGGLLWLMPKAFLAMIVVWILVFTIFRFVSLASIVCAIGFPATVWFFYPEEKLLLGFSCLLALMAIWRHRANIERLIAGTEHRWTKNKKVELNKENHP